VQILFKCGKAIQEKSKKRGLQLGKKEKGGRGAAQNNQL
jgi:hypothetical protein